MVLWSEVASGAGFPKTRIPMELRKNNKKEKKRKIFVYKSFTGAFSFPTVDRMPRMNAYCFTLNNWLPADRLRLEADDDNVRYIVFGEEVAPSTGTPHLQGYMQLYNEERMTTLNPRLFDNRARLTLAKGSAEQNKRYCTKDGVNVYERGSPRGAKGTRTDLDLVKKAIDDGKSYDEIADEFFGTVSRCDRFVRQRVEARDRGLFQSELKSSMSSVVLYTWQRDLLTTLSTVPHPRHVMWMWEMEGGKGKSFMARYLLATTSTLVLEAGKKYDLAHIVATTVPFPQIIVFDLARTTAPEEGVSHRLDSVYSMMESLKNGYLISTKYNSTTLTFKVPHVVVFANFEPDYSKMSADRWVVTHLADVM